MEITKFTARIPGELLQKLDEYRKGSFYKMSRNTAIVQILESTLLGKHNNEQAGECCDAETDKRDELAKELQYTSQ